MGAAGNTGYYYYETIRKTVAVFGALFNDIHTGRKLSSGALASVARVPLSYGPRSKFLSRIREDKNASEVGIKLPRMSFEITGIDYDAVSKLNSINRRKFCVTGSDTQRDSAFTAVPYNLSIDLNIFSRTQDEILQILEQILPVFTPDYTVSIKGMEGPGTVTDVPFILSGVNLSDEYEGDWLPARPIIYTISFTSKVKFLGGLTRQGIIERAMINFRDTTTLEFFGEKAVAVGDDDTIISYISSINPDRKYKITFEDLAEFSIGENVIGADTGYAGLVYSVSGNYIIVNRLENMYDFDVSYGIGEELIGETSEAMQQIVMIELYEA
ncbi:MAG: hypothetical protein D4S01_04505 [Dehalococcoidia bacterium]|nr:MAG: hypothetical protein D4S01_04505 [Dehalococcoidia bacterium]